MRKEILLAIVAGGLFGLIIAVGIWRARLFIKPESKVAEEIVQNEAPNAQQFGVTISSPEQKDVIVIPKTMISGITTPNAIVAISSEENDYITTSEEDGSFEQEVDLEAGINEVVLIATSTEGESATQKLVLVHTTKLDKPQIEEDQEEATESSESKIRDRIDEVLSSLKSYIGSVTDISKETIQISDFDFGTNTAGVGEILQISIAEELTDFVSIGKETKDITFEDVAIGDFIIAMGYTNGNSVLESSRILVVDTPTTTNRSVIIGSLNTISKGDIIINELGSNNEKSIITDKNTDVFTIKDGKIIKYDLDDAVEGVKIVAFGTPDEAAIDARTIYILTETDNSTTPPNEDDSEEE